MNDTKLFDYLSELNDELMLGGVAASTLEIRRDIG